MGMLIKFELDKLLKKKVVLLGMAAFGVIYVIMLYSWIFGNEWAMDQEGRMLYGQEAMAYNQEISLRYQGPLTDEKVQAILKEFPRTGDRTTGSVSNQTYYPVAKLFAEKDGTWNGKAVAQVFPEFKEPPQLGLSSRWESFLYSMTYIILLAGILVIIVVSPIFSEEYSTGADALILTSKHGRGQCIRAKIIASFCFVLLLASFLVGVGILVFLLGRGTAGWDAHIQLSELMVFSKIPWPLTCGQATGYMAVLAILSLLTLNGIVLLFSVVSQTPFVSVIASAVAYLTPMFFTPGSEAGKRFLFLFPVNSLNVSGVLNVSGLEVGSLSMSQTSLTGMVMTVALVSSVLVCQRVFGRHQVVG